MSGFKKLKSPSDLSIGSSHLTSSIKSSSLANLEPQSSMSSQRSSVSAKMNEIKRLKNEISQMKNDMHQLKSEKTEKKYPVEMSSLVEQPFKGKLMHSSTLPLDFTANLRNILEREEEYGVATESDKIKIQVFDLRKPEEGREAPLIGSIWAREEETKKEEDTKPARQQKPVMKQFKRKLTFEKQFTSEDMMTPITITVSDIKEQNQEDSDQEIPLIGLWGGKKQKKEPQDETKENEEDSFERTGVYYSPQGKKEKNKLKKSMTLQSTLSQNENFFKIDIHDLQRQGVDELEQENELIDLWKQNKERREEQPSSEESKTAHFKEQSQIHQPKHSSYSEQSSSKYEVKSTPPPPVRPGRQSERALNYMAADPNKRFQKLISAAMTSSYKAQHESPNIKSKGLKAFLHQQDVYSKAVQFLANDIENFVQKKPKEILKLEKHSFSESNLSLGKKSLSSLFTDQGQSLISSIQQSREKLLEKQKSLESEENIIHWMHTCIGPKNFEYLIQIMIEYSSLANFSSGSFSLDLFSLTKMHKDFEHLITLSKKEIEIMYKKSSQETKSCKYLKQGLVSIEQFFFILLEIADRVYPGIEQTTAVDKLVREFILRCDKMRLIKKFREIQDWRREANDSPVLQMMQLQNTEILLKVGLGQVQGFEEFGETNSSGIKYINGQGLARLFQKASIIPDLLSMIESIRLFFYAQKPIPERGLLEELDFAQCKATLVFISQAAIKSSQSPHQKFQAFLRILCG